MVVVHIFVSFTDYVAILMHLKYCCHNIITMQIVITIINISKYEKTRLAEVCILPSGTKTKINKSFIME